MNPNPKNMEQTISYLKSKVWYRLMKVVYIFLFFAVSTVMIVIIFSYSQDVLDIANSRVICQYSDKQFLIKEIFGKDEMPSTLPEEFYKVSDNSLSFSGKIIKSCETPLDPTKSSYTYEEIRAAGGRPLDSHGFVPLPYRIEKSYKNNIINSLLYSFSGLIIVMIIFEIIRRIFYYIILGTFRPHKNK